MFDRFMDNLVQISLYVGAAALVVSGFLFVLMPHSVTGYYIQESPELVTAYCVYADMQWGPDFVSYCSADIQQTGLVYTNLLRSMRFGTSQPAPPQIEIPLPPTL